MSDGVAVITLNRPDVLNAFDMEMITALQNRLQEAERDAAVRCLLLTGAGRGFSAGQDLAARADRSQPRVKGSTAEYLRQTFNPIVLKIRALEKPVIAAINGPVVGASLGVALACDIRFAADSAKLLAGFAKIGLACDAGVGWLLPQLVGMARAMEFLFSGDPLDAARAERWGLVNRVYPADTLMDEAMAYAKRLAQGPTRAIGLMKRAVNRSRELELAAFLDYEALVQDAAAQTADNREGVAAFMEKRAPLFKGK